MKTVYDLTEKCIEGIHPQCAFECCCFVCPVPTQCDMVLIAIDMILRGEY